MIESRCGIKCSECSFAKSMNCSGCVTMEKPFWGESCEVKSCCESKELENCGNCVDFPCDLLNQFSYDPEHGDDGLRIKQCRSWCEKTS